ncbi:MAG: hypothetical protein Q8L51_00290 [Candidatus Amesbacteria bacterium]|nr:hypothetical protein [Candidatus Amesbacteria bacterium]
MLEPSLEITKPFADAVDRASKLGGILKKLKLPGFVVRVIMNSYLYIITHNLKKSTDSLIG